MSRNGLYFILGALIVVVIALGAYIAHEHSKPSGVDIHLDKNGVKLQKE